ncbi:MAG: ATP-binding protein, partial [Candidatus Kapabacteria bacterium]|nr:ATP-binding protein [Candidatus Kapabacteria bacterium]
EAKRRAEASDSLKSAFIRNISHEIRTPLNGIIGYSSLLNMKDITTEEIAEYTSVINKSGVRLIEIINNVMDISQLESKQLELIPKYFDLNVTIKSVYQYYLTMASGTNIAFNLTFDDRPVELFSDEDRITQILNKLLSNAFKFTQSGSIELGGGVNKDELMVVIYIKDTGIGIDEVQQEMLFNAFTQVDMQASREYGGVGLGLAISAGLIHLLGGKIRCESALGKGTTFYIYLPLM